MKPFTMESLEKALCEKLAVNFGKQPEEASNQEMLRCCALVLRDVMSVRGVAARREVKREQKRQVHYLSLEFLMGRSLMKNAYNLGILPGEPGLPGRGPFRAGAGRGPRQRRPGPSRRLLPGLHDHSGHPRHRLLHLL